MNRYETAKREAWRLLSQLGEQPTREMLRELLDATEEQIVAVEGAGYSAGHQDGYDFAMDECGDNVAHGQAMAVQILLPYL